MTRALDIVASAFALALLSPLLIVITLVLRFSGEREVIFGQERIGLDGKPFWLYKFSTMLKNSPNIGTGILTLKNDSRILPFGGILRKTKLNELPQLFNVLVGDMSLIGPRPQTRPHFDVYPQHVKDLLKTVAPGLSGIGSIVFRDEEELLDRAHDKERFYAEVIAPYKGEVEIWYIERRGVWLYLCLIALTVWAVLTPGSAIHFRLFKDLPKLPAEILSAGSDPVRAAALSEEDPLLRQTALKRGRPPA